jgi:16S rRNA (adenine1518-N6/adenine1519-N6)-dimethyltransferase
MIEWDVAKPSQLKALLAEHGFSFKKQLGQNFLIDERILQQIVDAAELTSEDGAFEVGPGAGVVTQRLARIAKQVIAVEKDRSLSAILQKSLEGAGNVDVIFGDVLELYLPDIWKQFSTCKRVSVVANLPYYVTTPILFHLLESGVPLHNVIVMVQKEVADRLGAGPGTKDYGALSIAVQYRARVEKVVKVSPGSFLPPPGVDSMVVRLRCLDKPPVEVSDERTFFRVVKGAFAMRRKTLLNTLSGSLGLSKEACARLLQRCGIDSNRRGETLSLEEFASIANMLHNCAFS